MFCVDRPQFLLLTLDSYRRQFELLDAADFQAALDMLTIPVIGEELYVIFNGGEEAGCSRMHKHLQGLRGPPPAFGNFVEGESRANVPFRFFTHHFAEGFAAVTGEHMVCVYLKLIGFAKEALGLPRSASVCPHGLFMWRDWLVVIPRRRSGVDGTKASAATAGMLGSVWLSEEGPVADWVRLGLRDVLGQLGVPS
jgi:ATP adenylyltransferase/5',5'''-P-1,P-4-tetraphosphate phosphorylase II